jgi:hypothetical protein
MTKEVLKLALEAMEGADNIDVDMQLAIVKCREALAQPEHVTDGRDCWCNPEVNYVDPDTGAAVIVHKEPN